MDIIEREHHTRSSSGRAKPDALSDTQSLQALLSVRDQEISELTVRLRNVTQHRDELQLRCERLNLELSMLKRGCSPRRIQPKPFTPKS